MRSEVGIKVVCRCQIFTTQETYHAAKNTAVQKTTTLNVSPAQQWDEGGLSAHFRLGANIILGPQVVPTLSYLFPKHLLASDRIR